MSDFTSTGGGMTYYCTRCGKQIGHGCSCPPIIQPPPLPQYGWICPKCGRGNAPSTASCGCTAITIYADAARGPRTGGDNE